jgi:hypothetical protein
MQTTTARRSSGPIFSIERAKRAVMCEFEAWFLAAATSLAGQRGLRADLVPPPEPEAKRGAKEWLAANRTDGYAYSETTDQAALAAVFDLDQARRADSFDKCFRDVERLLREVQGWQG